MLFMNTIRVGKWLWLTILPFSLCFALFYHFLTMWSVRRYCRGPVCNPAVTSHPLIGHWCLLQLAASITLPLVQRTLHTCLSLLTLLRSLQCIVEYTMCVTIYLFLHCIHCTVYTLQTEYRASNLSTTLTNWTFLLNKKSSNWLLKQLTGQLRFVPSSNIIHWLVTIDCPISSQCSKPPAFASFHFGLLYCDKLHLASVHSEPEISAMYAL